MTPSRHLNRTQFYLNSVPGNIADGDYDRAADALLRVASHMANAAAVHWHHLKGARRRRQSALNDLVFKRSITCTRAGIFRHLHELPDRIRSAVADVPAHVVGHPGFADVGGAVGPMSRRT